MMPDLALAVRHFEDTIQFQIVVKTVVGMDVAETSKVPVVLWFEGTLQPLHPRELVIRMEGQKAFRYWTLYTEMKLAVDSVIKDQEGHEFRVMGTSDWRDANFLSYQLMEGADL